MKHLLSFLFAVLLSLLPSAMAAANAENRVKSIDVTMNLPSGGMTLDDGEKLAMTSAKTAFGDLVEKGVASIYEITWDGEFENDDSGPRFKADYNTRYSHPVRWRGGSMKDATRKVKNVMGKVKEKTRKGDGIVKKGFGLLKNIMN